MICYPQSIRAVLSIYLFFLSGISVNAVEQPNVGSVASAHPLATNAGLEILNSGGNAFDAAVAVAVTLAVVEPYSSGIGGGGFFLLYERENKTYTFIDAREAAPGASRSDMYLDSNGKFERTKSLNGPLAAAIPGLPAGLAHLSENFGKKSLNECFRTAIELADKGFAVGERYIRMAGFRAKSFTGEARQIFLKENFPSADKIVIQKDLANTLRKIASDNSYGFYNGDTAALLVEGVRKSGGIWEMSDLSSYSVIERSPLIGSYRNVKVISAPPPSSGGIVLLQALNILGNYDLDELSEVDEVHLITEAMRRAYRDRADFLGDPDFTMIDTRMLISKAHADDLAKDLNLEKATPSASLKPLHKTQEGEDTTHFSIIDKYGNRVAATLSINYPFGASFVVPRTGVLLNNEMDDFSALPFTPNAYGLIGTHANSIEPGKRPLSSMTPTFLETDDRVGIIGTPGGSRIISMVLLSVLDFVQGRRPDSWVERKRFHHQYMPDLLQFELGAFSTSFQNNLREKGHELREINRNYGNMQAILWDKSEGSVYSASDPRGEGSAGNTVD